jgi:hypothetical protein
MDQMFKLAALLQAKWQLMSPSEQFSASLNATADGFLVLFLFVSIGHMIQGAPDMWVVIGIFIVAVYIRFKQAHERWAL